jgi:hypothetical protein
LTGFGTAFDTTQPLDISAGASVTVMLSRPVLLEHFPQGRRLVIETALDAGRALRATALEHGASPT